MKKYIILISLFTALREDSYGQKENYIWPMGHDSFSSDSIFGGVNVDFNDDTVRTYRVERFIEFGKGNCSSICDSNGQLLIYSNGCFVANKGHQLMENGDSINAGEIYDSYCGNNNLGYISGFQSSMILPMPGSDSLFYLIHKHVTLVTNPLSAVSFHLLYSLIDISQNGGLGKVIEKNALILHDTLAFGDMTAVRHANGIDWWVVTPGYRNNKYFIFVFNQEGIHLDHIQTLGAPTPPAGEGGGQSLFSPDGSKYIRFNPHNRIRMFDFDRNTGWLSNYQHINVNYGGPVPFDGGCLISPSGQFLYISVKRYLYQLDLRNADIEATQQLVAEYDGYADPLATNFGRGGLGPDCKLYIFPGNDCRVIHVVHNPDQAGVACNVAQHAVHTPTFHGGDIPNFPNFRLRALGEPVSPCEGYTVPVRDIALPALPDVSVYPNPASQALHIGLHTNLETAVRWVLYDLYGRPVRSQEMQPQDTQWEVGITGLPPGVYLWQVSGKGTRSVGGKVIVKG